MRKDTLVYKDFIAAVHLSPELHRRLARVAVETGVSLNQLVQNAIEGEFREKEVGHGVGPGEGTADV